MEIVDYARAIKNQDKGRAPTSRACIHKRRGMPSGTISCTSKEKPGQTPLASAENLRRPWTFSWEPRRPVLCMDGDNEYCFAVPGNESSFLNQSPLLSFIKRLEASNVATE
jgi:hypothetical protein